MRCWLLLLLLGFALTPLHAEDGYRLWLRYDAIKDQPKRQQYLSQLSSIYIDDENTAAKNELTIALSGLLEKKPVFTPAASAGLIITTAKNISDKKIKSALTAANDEGYVIGWQHNKLFITANTNAGLLYGTFRLIQLIQQNESLNNLFITNSPSLHHRILNHWDNLDRSVERGYAGQSLWKWHLLPGYIDPRYRDYARANASVGINGTVLTNVNANARVLTDTYLKKAAALADVFRPYHIRVYLTARFSAPIEIGGLRTADPLDPEVKRWWKNKAAEIYQLIPDFGGFLVKANSEGQPGPQDYQRSHADGANMLAEALAPHGGIVMWRAFVYSHETPDDRAKQAYTEFKPLDGKFLPNVILQVKNGAIDFQPREPFHPLFGAMPQTPLMMEVQLTQEYLGAASHLVYLAPLFKEVLDADTYQPVAGNSVASVLQKNKNGGIAGVANIGDERNWCGHPFAQSNWFAFGRLAWNPAISSKEIAREWIRLTFGNNATVANTLTPMLLQSRETAVNYMTPLGLHHIMAYGHHYGPGPWVANKPRADWTSVYYHRADSTGIGFDRTATGSNALSQYAAGAQRQWENPATCDEKFLLWFHHVPWNHRMQSGRNLWEEICYRYNTGVSEVRDMQTKWHKLKPYIDEERFEQVRMLLNIQEENAVLWRDACVAYFQTFSRQPLPANYPQPAHSLDYYQQQNFYYMPGNPG
ncbi:alpha-glucuronidase family glycosyl hydrolase [Terrimonas ferruginea]|uniref:alpha-glucuronidase family glycosyl hydrolase n=1 Tax=Terrimonas ferruginea TaxID=249 RepID=UPI00042970E3|nr:alpha-glucuronidase family glycosyl hydrolase [Terrimonas ferruginea]